VASSIYAMCGVLHFRFQCTAGQSSKELDGVQLMRTRNHGDGWRGFHWPPLVEHVLKNTGLGTLLILDSLSYASNGWTGSMTIKALDESRVKMLTIDLTRKTCMGRAKGDRPVGLHRPHGGGNATWTTLLPILNSLCKPTSSAPSTCCSSPQPGQIFASCVFLYE